MHDPHARLNELGIALPQPVAPIANYVPFVQSANLLHISGQIAIGPDGLVTGILGKDIEQAAGYEAAKFCAINLLAQAASALNGDLSRIRQVVKLGGFMQTNPSFTDIPAVMNGASDLMVAVFGDIGRHARFAVGCSSLPMGSAVEVDGLFEIKS